MKCKLILQSVLVPPGRTPQGVRGLKCEDLRQKDRRHSSHPARGAWIEISALPSDTGRSIVAPRKGCVD